MARYTDNAKEPGQCPPKGYIEGRIMAEILKRVDWDKAEKDAVTITKITLVHVDDVPEDDDNTFLTYDFKDE